MAASGELSEPCCGIVISQESVLSHRTENQELRVPILLAL